MCLKLEDHVGLCVTEPDFPGKISFSEKRAKKAPKGPKNRVFGPLRKIDSLVVAINYLKWWFLWLANFPLHDKWVEILFWRLHDHQKLGDIRWNNLWYTTAKISLTDLKFGPDDVLNTFWKFTPGFIEISFLEKIWTGSQ